MPNLLYLADSVVHIFVVACALVVLRLATDSRPSAWVTVLLVAVHVVSHSYAHL